MSSRSSVDVDRGAPPSRETQIASELEHQVETPQYPCLGARSVFHTNRATVRLFDELGTAATAPALLEELIAFSQTTDREAGFASFVAVFPATPIEGETQFEELLWRQLQLVHDLDAHPWDPAVSHDPADSNFAFSAGGIAYFIVGLHPMASRLARRAEFATLVFNLHSQFEALRASGRYERLRDTIRSRDEHLQGSVNPMVCDHGRAASACQYSGRLVPKEWTAPFEFRGRVAKAA